MTKPSIALERIRELLDYDPETGIFTWRVSRQKARAGNTAGTRHRGYIVIGLELRTYRAHRLAWIMMTGEWPKGEIDHKDGVRSNNRFDNLRDVTHQTNCENQREPQSNNTLRVRGVYRANQLTGFYAQIGVRGKTLHLGTFATTELAYAAYLEAKRRLHEGNML